MSSELTKKIAHLQLTRKIITWKAMDEELAEMLKLSKETDRKVKNISSNTPVIKSVCDYCGKNVPTCCDACFKEDIQNNE